MINFEVDRARSFTFQVLISHYYNIDKSLYTSGLLWLLRLTTHQHLQASEGCDRQHNTYIVYKEKFR